MNAYQKELVKRALSDCIVLDGEIMFLSPLSPDELRQVYAGLTEDLFSFNIPHYRIVGILFTASKMYTKSVIRKHEVFDRSIVELAEEVSMVIPLSLGGNNKEDDCYRFSDVAVSSSNNKRLDVFRSADNIPDWKKNKFPFQYNPDEIGQLVYTIDNLALAEYGINEKVMSTDTLLYNSAKIVYDQNNLPDYLINDITLADMSDTQGVKLSDIVFFYHKGKGMMDYNQTAEFFKYDSDIFPCRAIYDLSRIFNIVYPMPTDTSLRFYTPYHERFNIKGLEQILHEYALELEVEDGNTD